MNKLAKNIVAGAVLAFAALRGGAYTINENLTLEADLDLRDESGAVTIPADVTVDLNGHRLTVKGLSCAGSIVNSAPGYQPLEYIESDGKQWIDTGYLTTADTAIEIDFTTTGVFNNGACFCGDWGDNGHLLVLNTTTAFGRHLAFYGPKTVILSNAEDRRYRFVTVPGAAQTAILYDGATGEQLAAASPSLARNASGTMTLFAANEIGDQPAKYRLHAFKLTDTKTGKVERDFVPVRSLADDEIGLYDRAHDLFYPRHENSTAPFASNAYAAQPTLASGRLVVDASDGAAYAVSGRCDVRVEILDGSALSADGDLRCFGKNLEVGGTLSLNDHRLRVAGLGGAGTVRPGAVNNGGGYRYYRFKVDAVRSGTMMQIGEVKLFSGDTDVSRQYTGIDYPTTSKWAATYDPKKALDGSLDTKWFDQTNVTGCGPDLLYFDLDYGSPVVVTRYQWYTGADTGKSGNEGRNPKSWRLQGSNDKTNWQDLDVVENNTTVTTDSSVLAYDKVLTYEQSRNDAIEVEVPDNSDSYRYYKFKVDAVRSGSQMQIGEFKLFNGDTDVSHQYREIKYDKNSSFPVYTPDKCFDGLFGANDKWFDNRSAELMYFILDYGEPVVVTRYQWYTGNDTNDSDKNKGRNPKSWRLQGSNDDVTWRDLDVVCGNATVTTANSVLAYEKVLTAPAEVTARIADVFSLVKRGAGAALVPDTALASVANVAIDEGVVKVRRTGLVKADCVPGELSIADGALLDLNAGGNELVLSGILSGGGSLSGDKVRFSGENTCWRMVADDTGFTNVVDISGVTDATFLAGLKRMEIAYTGEAPDGKVLAICPAFAQLDAAGIQLAVTDGEGKMISDCWLEVADGLLKIHFAERTVRTAEWTNGSGDGNVANPKNWNCFDEGGKLISDALPTNATTVVLGADCRFVCTNAAPLVCGKVSFAPGASLAADCDWRGLAGVPFEGTLDLAGHALTIGLPVGAPTLTDGQPETPGEVRIDVPAGVAVTNVSVALQGNLRLVKTGEGTLVAARNGQTYTGGTVVREGVLKPGADSDTTLFGAAHSELTVEKGAQYWDDVYAPWATQYLRFRIAGTGPDGTGAIRTTHVSTGDINNAKKGWLEALTLTDDAEIARDAYAFSLIANNYGYLPLTLNGHTLTFTSDTLTKSPNWPYLLASSLSGTPGDTGSIVVGDNLQFYPYSGKDSDLSNYRFVVTANASYSSGTDANACNLTVSNFVYRSDSGLSQVNKLTTVVGTYAPLSTTSAPKVQLGNATHLATTLDLSERTAAFDVDFGGGLAFAEGSVVNVRLGERRPKGEARKLLSWTSRPQGVRFVLCERKLGGLAAREDGLYLVSGMVITFR